MLFPDTVEIYHRCYNCYITEVGHSAITVSISEDKITKKYQGEKLPTQGGTFLPTTTALQGDIYIKKSPHFQLLPSSHSYILS